MAPTPTLDARLDIDFARSHFPNLANGWAFFENAGGSYVPQSVIDRVHAYMSETQVQPGASFGPSALAAERMAQGQQLMAQLINADPREVIIGPSTTANIYVLAHALRPWFEPDGEIIVTNLDHEANSGAWRRLADSGVTVKEWRFCPETGELHLEDLDKLLTERTVLVSCPHCSNITGSIIDVAGIIAKVHAASALVCVDGVAYAPHRAIDVKALDADFYVLSLYKVYGPHLALLYGKTEHLHRASAQNHFFIGDESMPLKLNPGGPNHELTAGLAGVADYFDALYHHHFEESDESFHRRAKKVYGLFAQHEETLATRLVNYLASQPRVRVLGRPTAKASLRAPTFSFVIEGRRSADFPPLVEANKVAMRNGNFYAYRCVRDFGLDPDDGVIRASLAHYNTLEEIDRLIQGLERAMA